MTNQEQTAEQDQMPPAVNGASQDAAPEQPAALPTAADEAPAGAEDAAEQAADAAADEAPAGAEDAAEQATAAADEAPAGAEDAAEHAADAANEAVPVEVDDSATHTADASAAEAPAGAEDAAAQAEQADVEATADTENSQQDTVAAEAPSVATNTAAPDAVTEDAVASDDEAAASEIAPAVDRAAAGEVDGGASYVPPADEEEGGRPRRLKDLAPDMELDGRVTSIALYGIFVDIGVGRDGLVHISEMSDTRIDSPSDLVQIGDTVKVRVKSVDPDARRISLTMRSKERPEGQSRRGGGGGGGGGGRKRSEVDSERLTTLKVGDTVDGTVTGLAPFGAFVDIGVGKDGLVHISELSEGRVDRPEDAVQVGERYTFKLLEVDPEGTRISLSLRKAQRGQRMQQLEKGAILDGTVSGLATFGAFVDIGVGRDGLVHISELSDGRVGKVEDAVQVGQKVKVRVLEVDPNSKRISLTMRLEDRPERPEASDGERPPRSERNNPERFERGAASSRPDRGERERPAPRPQPQPVRETIADPEEEVQGNATLEDLVSKFGGSATSRRDKKRRQDEEEEEGTGDRFNRRQRDAIRRTLQQMDDE